MLTWLGRVVGYFIGFVFLVLLGVFLYTSFFFELADYRDQISTWATEKLQSEVIVNGDIQLKWRFSESWPTLTISLQDVVLKEDRVIGTEDLFRVNQLTADFSVNQLFLGQISPKIALDTPYVRLVRINDKITNWNSLSSVMRPDGTSLSETDLGIGLLLGVASGLTIANGSIEWINQHEALERRMSAIELRIPAIAKGGASYFAAAFDLGNHSALDQFTIEMSATVSRGSLFEPVILTTMDVELLAPGILIALQASKVRQRVAWDGFDIDGLRASGAIGDQEFQIVNDRIIYAQSVESIVMKNTYATWFTPLVDLRASFDSIELSDVVRQLEQPWRSRNFDAIADTLWLLIDSAQLGIDGDLEFHVSEPYALFNSFQLSSDLSYPSIEGALSGRLNFSIREGIRQIKAFQFNWEESILSGALTVLPSGVNEFSFDLIEQDVQLTSSREGKIMLTKGLGVLVLAEVFYHWNFPADGNIKISRARWGNVELRNVHIPLYSLDGKISSKKAELDLYGGHATIDTLIDHTPHGIRIQSSQNYQGISLLPILRDLGFTEMLDAEADLVLEIKLFDQRDEFTLAGVDATARLDISTGRVRELASIEFLGASIGDYIYESRRLLGIEKKWQEGDDTIDFRDGKLVLRLENEQIFIEKLSLNTSGIGVKATGQYLSGPATFDTLWYLSWTESLKGTKFTFLDQLDNIVIPLRVRGSHNNVRVSLDMPELISLLGRAP